MSTFGRVVAVKVPMDDAEIPKSNRSLELGGGICYEPFESFSSFSELATNDY